MTEHDHAVKLFAMALKDVRALIAMMNPQVFSDEIFGFHAQQTVEKALKAWLSQLKIEYPKTHDISFLLKLLEKKKKIAKKWKNLIEFNVFAVQYRYEAFDLEESLDRKNIIHLVKTLIAKVRRELKVGK